MENKRAEELNRKRKESESLPWWEKPIEELNRTQLNELKGNLEHLKQVLTKRIESLFVENFADVGNITNTPALNMLLPPPPHVVIPGAAPGPPLALLPPSGAEMTPLEGFSNKNLMMMQTAPVPKFSVGSCSNDGPMFNDSNNEGPMFNDSNFNYSGPDILHTLVPPPPAPPTSTVTENEVQQNLQQGLPDFTPGFNDGFY